MADPSADGAVRICDGNKGENLELCEDYLLARRTASFYHSSCYLANPLRETMMRIGEQTHIGYSIALEIVEVEDWAGGLKLGFTVTNPSDIQFASIHITEVPYMCGFDFDGAMVTSNVVDAVGVQTNGPSQTLPHRHTKTDKVRAILSLSTKKLLLEFNETIVPMDFPVPESVKWAGLTSGTPVWGLIEPYGASALSLSLSFAECRRSLLNANRSNQDSAHQSTLSSAGTSSLVGSPSSHTPPEASLAHLASSSLL